MTTKEVCEKYFKEFETIKAKEGTDSELINEWSERYHKEYNKVFKEEHGHDSVDFEAAKNCILCKQVREDYREYLSSRRYRENS